HSTHHNTYTSNPIITAKFTHILTRPLDLILGLCLQPRQDGRSQEYLSLDGHGQLDPPPLLRSATITSPLFPTRPFYEFHRPLVLIFGLCLQPRQDGRSQEYLSLDGHGQLDPPPLL